MRFHYGGKFVSEEELQRKGSFHDQAVPFREPGQTVFSVIANGGCILLLLLMLAIVMHAARSELSAPAWDLATISMYSMP
jgi:hypothetical protein